MRNSATFLTRLALGLAIAGSVTACKQSATDTKAPAAVTVADKETIVFVNQDTLLAKYEYAKDVNAKLQTKGKATQSDVAAKEQAFQRDVAEYQRNANTMSADQRAATEQRLQRNQQNLQQYAQSAGAEIQNEQGTEANKLYDKIADFTKTYAKEKGYKMVLTYSKANPTVLYGDASLDVTGDVVKKLNDAYAKDKK